MIFDVRLSKKAAKKLKQLDDNTRERIKDKLKNFANEPFSHDVKKLIGSQDPPLYRLRVGDYRIIFWIDWNKQTIFVEQVIHRSEGYDTFLD